MPKRRETIGHKHRSIYSRLFKRARNQQAETHYLDMDSDRGDDCRYLIDRRLRAGMGRGYGDQLL